MTWYHYFFLNSISEDTANCSATQVKKKVEDVETTTDESEDTDIRSSEPQPCTCVYQHAREITERKKEVLENPPCPCLLNSKRKWDTCPCLTKCNYRKGISNYCYRKISIDVISDNCYQLCLKRSCPVTRSQCHLLP